MSTDINIGKKIAILDEGSSITTDVSQINFTGSGVAATAVGNNVTVNVTGSGITVGSTTSSGVNSRVFFQAGGVVQQDGAFNWDNTNKRLGIGANATSPSAALNIRTNIAVANDILTIQNGFYGNTLFRIRDNAGASASLMGAVYCSSLIYGGDSGVTRRFDLGGFGLGASFGDSGANAVWENNQGNIGDGQGTSVIAVSSNFYVNLQTTKKYKFEALTGNFGIGNVGTLGARLDVRAQGALSTDIAFRVRNSADTADIAAVQGNGNILFNNTTHGLLFNSQTVGSNQLELYSYGIASVIVNPFVSRFAFTGASSVKGVVIGNSSTAPAALLDVWDFAGPGPGTTVARFGSQYNSGTDNLNILFSTRYSGFTASTAHLARLNIGQTGSGANLNARSYFKFELIRNNTLAERASITSQSNLLLQTPTEDTNDIGVIYIPNGTAPTVALAGGGKLYVEGGALKYIGSSGTISVIAPA